MSASIPAVEESKTSHASNLMFHLKPRPVRTPSWASKKWSILRGFLPVGEVCWDDRVKCYKLNPVRDALYDSADLHDIGEFLRDKTQSHRFELFERKRERTAKQVIARKKKR